MLLGLEHQPGIADRDLKRVVESGYSLLEVDVNDRPNNSFDNAALGRRVFTHTVITINS